MIFELHNKTITQTIREITPSGIKVEVNEEGQASGRLNAAHFDTVYINEKPDGSGQWESKSIARTPDGEMIVGTGKGTMKTTGPGMFSVEGEVHFMTQSPKLSWLNNKKGWFEATENQNARELHGKVYEMK